MSPGGTIGHAEEGGVKEVCRTTMWEKRYCRNNIKIPEIRLFCVTQSCAISGEYSGSKKERDWLSTCGKRWEHHLDVNLNTFTCRSWDDPNDELTTQPVYNNNPPAWRECAHQDHMAEVLIWSWGYSARKCWQYTHPLVHWGVSWATWALSQQEFCYTDLPVNEEVRNIRCASTALLCHHLIKKKKSADDSTTRLFFWSCSCQHADTSAPGFSE